MIPGHRSNDAVITICQDNARRSIEVRDLNPPAKELLGYATEDVNGQPLTRFLPVRIQELLSEYVEYEDDGNDVGSVLGKVQSFCIVNSKKKEVAFRLKVLRSESLDKNAYFRLILQNRTEGRREEAFRAVLRDNFKGHEVLDKYTGLPDRQSIIKDIELVRHYVSKDMLISCFAVLEIDQYAELREAHGEVLCYSLLKHMAAIARQSLRNDDTIGCAGPHRMGIILMDTTPDSARMVLNRLRWLMAATPYTLDNKETLPVTVSIAFSRLGPRSGYAEDKNLLERVEKALSANPSTNAMVEVAD